MTSPRPPWRDQAAVAVWVLTKCRKALLHAQGLVEGPQGDIYSIEDADPEPSDQEQAIEAATRGKPSKLAGLIKDAADDAEFKIEPDALRLVAEFLSGERNLRTGRTKAEQQRGRPKMATSERAAKTRTHDAAKYYYPAVRQVLRQEYPGQSRGDHHDCALYITSRWTKVKANTIANYLHRGEHDPHRI
jgi:hypothetical protein